MNQDKKVTEVLGQMRKGLVAEGFTEDQAFSLVVDLLRKAADLDDLMDAAGKF